MRPRSGRVVRGLTPHWHEFVRSTPYPWCPGRFAGPPFHQGLPTAWGALPLCLNLRPLDLPEEAAPHRFRTEDYANGYGCCHRPAKPSATLARGAETPPYGGGSPDTKKISAVLPPRHHRTP